MMMMMLMRMLWMSMTIYLKHWPLFCARLVSPCLALIWPDKGRMMLLLMAFIERDLSVAVDVVETNC